MTDIPDQAVVWNRKHTNGDHEILRHTPSPLASLAEPYFIRGATILELGCGVGRDAIFLEQKGHTVLATDTSEVAIAQNKQHFPDSNVQFSILDMRKSLPYEAEHFDVVYANLALHYYSHQDTQRIIDEIARVLKTGGILAFACKSVDDFHNGNGEEVEENVFVAKNGHARHLFSIPYAQELLKNLFDIEYLDEVEEEYNNQKSSIVRCVARKVKDI